jgi:hypothetical protein
MVPAVVEVTAAVKVMLAPFVAGLLEEVSAVVVLALLAALTTCEIAGEVLNAKLGFPL